MFNNILVPIDMAHIAEGKIIIDTALQHGGKDAKIFLLNVVEEVPTWAAVELPDHILEKSIDNARAELTAIANASGAKMEVMVRIGRAYNTILAVAEETETDLIIIASHRPGFQDYFLGSTAAKVVRHASCSVLVVR